MDQAHVSSQTRQERKTKKERKQSSNPSIPHFVYIAILPHAHTTPTTLHAHAQYHSLPTYPFIPILHTIIIRVYVLPCGTLMTGAVAQVETGPTFERGDFDHSGHCCSCICIPIHSHTSTPCCIQWSHACCIFHYCTAYYGPVVLRPVEWEKWPMGHRIPFIVQACLLGRPRARGPGALGLSGTGPLFWLFGSLVLG